MVTAEECILKADNYASAAMLGVTSDTRGLIRMAAIWRNRALRLKLTEKLGARAGEFLIAEDVRYRAAGW